MENKFFEISWNSLWRVLVFVAALFLIYLIRDILIVLFSAMVVAAVCHPFIDFLQRKRVHRLLGTLLVFILILAISGIFLWLVIPLVISQFGDFINNFNEIIFRIDSQSVLGEIVQQLIVNLKSAFDVLTKSVASVLGFIFSVFGGISMVLICLVLAFYFALEEKEVEKFFREILPDRYENRIIAIFSNSTRRIGRWFQGRLFLSLIVGLLTWLGLYFLGVKYHGTLGLLAAVLDLIPIVGPIFAGLIAFLVAVTDSLWLGIWVILLVIIIQQLENILFVPLIFKKIAGLHPLVTLIALLIGAKLAGLVGFILAVPAAIIIQEIFRVWENSTSPQP